MHLPADSRWLLDSSGDLRLLLNAEWTAVFDLVGDLMDIKCTFLCGSCGLLLDVGGHHG
jgi:hypothetical protein